MTKPSTFDDAFKILDQAINDQQLPNLRSLLDDEIRSFKTAVRSETTNSLQELGLEHAYELGRSVDKYVRKNPLISIGAVAAGALALGFLLSRPRSEKVSAAGAPVDRKDFVDRTDSTPSGGLDSGAFADSDEVV